MGQDSLISFQLGTRRDIKSLGPKRSVQFSKGTLRHVKIRERKGPSQGVVQQCVPHERGPYAPKFEDRSEEEDLIQERRACRVVWNMAKRIHKLKEKDEATFYSPSEAPSSTKPEDREFVVDSGASMHMLSRRYLNSAELDTVRVSRTPTTAITANGEV